VEFSKQQEAALKLVSDWLRSSDSQVFRLFGFAGTGKTTLARHFAQDIGGRVHFCAFTGKAAYVLRQKGCIDAGTIHQLIYQPKDRSKARLLELEELLAAGGLPRRELVKLQQELRKEKENATRPLFSLNLESEIRDCKLVVVDECSMVDERIGQDLMSFGVKILVLGDPAQLPPVKGTGFFTDCEPDYMLTDIHRQAKGDPIIELATKCRQNTLPDYGTYGESRVMSPRDFKDSGAALACDQIIVGRNATRHSWNSRMRHRLGYEGNMPLTGDRLVCLRNDHERGLLNGGIWTCATDALWDKDAPERCLLEINSEDDDTDTDTLMVTAHSGYFRGEEIPWFDRKDAQEFDYGYALTCHKSQGSQWDHVVVWDESACFRKDRWRWLYTAVTRAAKKLDLVLTNA